MASRRPNLETNSRTDIARYVKRKAITGKGATSSRNTFANIDNLKKWIAMNAKIEIKDISEMKLAGITQIGVVGMEQAFERLIRWATPKGLM